MASDLSDAGRREMVAYLRRHLLGPVGGIDEVITDAPTERYTVGVLYPQAIVAEDAQEGQVVFEHQADAGTGEGDGPADEAVPTSYQSMTSSAGISFHVVADAVSFAVSGATYEWDGRAWARSQLGATDGTDYVELRAPEPGVHRVDPKVVLAGQAELRVTWRPRRRGHLVTAAIVNTAERERKQKSGLDENCLFQVGLECRSVGGSILRYPMSPRLLVEDEEEELELRYGHLGPFAAGHGTSVRWTGDGEAADGVAIEWLPTWEIDNLVPKPSSSSALALDFLANEEDSDVLSAALAAEFEAYGAWVDDERRRTDIPDRLMPARDRLLDAMEDMVLRVDEGIRLLGADPLTHKVFRLANQAMLGSMRRKDQVGDERRPRDEGSVDDVVNDEPQWAWRPFQLAFQLAVLPSLVDGSHPDRRLVDLLWFPTGGGKTEAYLGLAAMAIVLRRLGAGPRGVVVLSRYTLRLLTTQQFQRSATMIASLELIRRERVDLGSHPIRIGLWIGRKASPNKVSEAIERAERTRGEDHPRSRFVLDACPWCATLLVPDSFSEDDEDYGLRWTPTSFGLNCPSADCPFHENLPVEVVNDQIYGDPPDFLLATVDMFAQMAMREEAGRLIGAGGRGPSLVIQDELHLLSGPLGTMVGLYEAALQGVMEASGTTPKIVASTATIRRARDQVKGLFGREVSVFPPPGLRSEDSYFARSDRSDVERKPGRLYVGVLSQTQTPTSALVHTAAALMQGQAEVNMSEVERDSMGTLIAYFNSKRELGHAVTMARDDIPDRMGVLKETAERPDISDSVDELTSNLGDWQITDILTRLGRPADDGGIAFLASTNMIGVGVDVPRLSLMLVNGQPKTTAEYIQATSRVGRSAVPGLVVTLYSGSKPRDISHFETFGGYHAALYRWVEPTSVTPFAAAARHRALHAALVILVRHTLGLGADSSVSRFDKNLAGLDSVVDRLVAKVQSIDEDEVDATREDLNVLIDEWDDFARRHGDRARYHAWVQAAQYRYLLHGFSELQAGEWLTPASMRNVDVEALVKVRGAEA